MLGDQVARLIAHKNNNGGDHDVFGDFQQGTFPVTPGDEITEENKQKKPPDDGDRNGLSHREREDDRHKTQRNKQA